MCIKYIFLTIIILIILLLLYLTILYNLYKTNTKDYKNHRIYKKILFSNLKPYLKSGDLLFFSSINTDVKTRSWINNRFSHVGMVVKNIDENQNELYVLELMNNYFIKPFQKIPNNGLNLLPLFDRIVNYSGSVYYSSLKIKLSKEQENRLKRYIKNMNLYKYNKISSIIYSLFTHSNKLDNYNRFCTEFIAEVLDDLDISSKPLYSSKLNLPNEIFKLTNGEIYTNPIHILCDGLIIKKISDGSYLTYC